MMPQLRRPDLPEVGGNLRPREAVGGLRNVFVVLQEVDVLAGSLLNLRPMDRARRLQANQQRRIMHLLAGIILAPTPMPR